MRRFLITSSLLVLFLLVTSCLSLLAQADGAGGPADPRVVSVSPSASKEEVQELRDQVAAQQKTIEELRAMVQQLAKQQESGETRVVNAAVIQQQPADEEVPLAVAQKSATKSGESPLTAGWNGEHFFLTSSDGTFLLMPVGYLNAQYNFYKGDGAPSDTFSIKRARFGVQGNYGKQLDYAFLFETASTLTIRDAYVDFKPWNGFKIMGGQFKVPFSMEVGTGDTNVEFYDRSIISVLYPDAGGGFRAPGIDAHGDLFDGRMQYWVGLFNGQGLLTSGTTNEPEVVGRLRFSPWKNSHGSAKGLSFGGSAEHSRSKGLALEQSFSGVMNDGTYTFFPQFRINGGVERYNGFFSFLRGPLGVRGEYAQLLQKRDNIGSLTPGGIGFNTIPGVIGKGAYVSVNYLLTGEREPENAIPRVKHPVIGPPSPGESGAPGWGAWQLKFRYSWLEGKAPGATCDATTVPACPITPAIVAPYSDHTDQFTVGVNWYLNYWVLVKSDFNVDRLINPSVQGILPQNYFVFVEGLQFRF